MFNYPPLAYEIVIFAFAILAVIQLALLGRRRDEIADLKGRLRDSEFEVGRVRTAAKASVREIRELGIKALDAGQRAISELSGKLSQLQLQRDEAMALSKEAMAMADA